TPKLESSLRKLQKLRKPRGLGPGRHGNGGFAQFLQFPQANPCLRPTGAPATSMTASALSAAATTAANLAQRPTPSVAGTGLVVPTASSCIPVVREHGATIILTMIGAQRTREPIL